MNPSTTVLSKRRRGEKLNTSGQDAFDKYHSSSDDEIDISSALVGKKVKIIDQKDSADEDIEELEKVIRDATKKRDIRDGTKLLKKTKGRSKIVKGEIGGGSFQSMGLHPSILRSLNLRGYRIPTPIQRLAIPSILSSPPRDLVGMARTGSGKTLAYMIPLIQRLGGQHATTFGTRALILVPTRELALQVLKVGKELARGWNNDLGSHAGDAEEVESTKTQNLRWCLVVGGEGMDEQFEMITSNPDVIIATPGRLLHLIVEMNLDLKAAQYVVFDEADRLFEMGFSTALNEIIYRLPSNRQTFLFSATLPKSLVEFAKAGLQDPKLIRLDADSKISRDLRMAFFSVKQAEKDANLLILLKDLISVPLGVPEPSVSKDSVKGKSKEAQCETAPYQTLIFTATKHHVEYLTTLLSAAGYAVSHIYGTLDQTARSIQMDSFRRRLTSILVVTDVAARGIDIPVLENVVNYDFPHGARVFVHRVGRTARAGRKGWAWSFVSNSELPHLLDLQLFLGRAITNGVKNGDDMNFTDSLILGAMERDKIDQEIEYIKALDGQSQSLISTREVMKKGQAMYERSQGKASQASYKRAKEMISSGKWGFTARASEATVHPVFRQLNSNITNGDDIRRTEDTKNALLRAIENFTPLETVLELGTKGKNSNVTLMNDRRKTLSKARERRPQTEAASKQSNVNIHDAEDPTREVEIEMADEKDIAAAFEDSGKKGGASEFRDSQYYMSHYQKDAATEKGYSLKDGISFAEQARGATFEIAGDESLVEKRRRDSKLTWDRKKKKFIQGDRTGADNIKLVKSESGARLPATYRSGRFDEWKAKTRRSLPRIGDAEKGENGLRGLRGSKRFKHHSLTEAKPLNKMRTDYERKVRQTKKIKSDINLDNANNFSKEMDRGKNQYTGSSARRTHSELKSADQIRKSRQALERKKAKNARFSRKKSRR